MAHTSMELLLVTESLTVREQVTPIAAAVGLGVQVADTIDSVLHDWLSYTYVVIGEDQAPSLAQNRPPRRAGVVIVHGDRVEGLETSNWERELWKSAVAIGADNVIGLPSSAFWLSDALRACAPSSNEHGLVMAFIPGSGGSGASTAAVNVGMRAVSRGTSAVVIDADSLGGGLDLILGAEEMSGTRWGSINPGEGRIAASTLASALPVSGGLAFLSHTRREPHQPQPDMLAAVIDAARRTFDLVVVDLPHSISTETELVVSLAKLTAITVRNHVRSVAAGASVHQWVRESGGNPHYIISTDHKGVSFPDIALALGERSLSEIPFIPSMSTRADEGELPAMPTGYAAVCDHLIDRVSATGDRVAA